MNLLAALFACSTDKPVDFDNDGHPVGEDCNDNDAFIHPGAREYCDGADNDCDGAIDGAGALNPVAWYEDDDGDGYGDPDAPPVEGCDPGFGYSRTQDDCNDADPAVHPNVPDGCDGVDDDCSGLPDDAPAEPRFADVDGDGYGDALSPVATCEGSSAESTDCDDLDPAVYPGAPEVCDGRDTDCDLLPDDIDAVDAPPTWYADLDGDGFGTDAVSLVQCAPPSALWSLASGDCDDLDPESHPGALQLCTARDTDCDGAPGDSASWYDPASPWRILLQLDQAAEPGALFELSVDLSEVLSSLGAIEPASVRLVAQECGSDSPRLLPVAASDTLAPWLSGGSPEGVEGDGLWTFITTADEAMEAGSTLALYLGGPALVQPGAVSATESSLSSPRLTATFDPDRGGLLDALSLSGGTPLVSQADARLGNGILSGGVFTQLGPAEMTLLHASPAAAVLRADGLYGGLRYRAYFAAIEGRPELFVTLSLSAEEAIVWEEGSSGVRPFDIVPVGLSSPVPGGTPEAPTLSDGASGVQIAWIDLPLDGAVASCTEEGCSASGTEGQGPLGSASPGEILVSDRLLSLLPYAGTVPPALPAAGVVTVGPVEALPALASPDLAAR